MGREKARGTEQWVGPGRAEDFVDVDPLDRKYPGALALVDPMNLVMGTLSDLFEHPSDTPGRCDRRRHQSVWGLPPPECVGSPRLSVAGFGPGSAGAAEGDGQDRPGQQRSRPWPHQPTNSETGPVLSANRSVRTPICWTIVSSRLLRRAFGFTGLW